MPVLVFDHPTLEQCSAYPIGCSHEWLLLVSSPYRLQEYQARGEGGRRRARGARGALGGGVRSEALGDVGLARRGSGLRRRRRRCSGTLGSCGGGEQGTAATPGADQETKCLGEGRRRKEIYGGASVPGEATTQDKRPFYPGWWLHQGQKGGLLSRVNPPPGTKGDFVPGGGFTRDKRPPI